MVKSVTSLPGLLAQRSRGIISLRVFQRVAEQRIYEVYLKRLEGRVGEVRYRELTSRVTFGGELLSARVIVKRLFVREFVALRSLSGYPQSEEWKAKVDPFLARAEEERLDVEEYLEMESWSNTPFTQLPKPAYAQPGETGGSSQFYLIMVHHSVINAAVRAVAE